MQASIGLRRPSPNIYLVTFDLLFLNGHYLRRMRLEDRREILQQMIPTGGRIQFREAMPGTGDAVCPPGRRSGLEGMVSKLKESPYQSGKTTAWRKINASRKSRWTSSGCNASVAKRRK
jgi:ATP-dependent DNA ligase